MILVLVWHQTLVLKDTILVFRIKSCELISTDASCCKEHVAELGLLPAPLPLFL